MAKAVVVVLLILLVLILALFLSSCSTMPTTVQESYNSLQDINDWIYSNIRYDNVRKTEDSVQTPQQTLALRSGSCFDMCKLFVYLADKSGWTVRLLPVELPNGNYHMLVDGGSLGIYDPTNGKRIGFYLPSGWKATTF